VLVSERDAHSLAIASRVLRGGVFAAVYGRCSLLSRSHPDFACAFPPVLFAFGPRIEYYHAIITVILDSFLTVYDMIPSGLLTFFLNGGGTTSISAWSFPNRHSCILISYV
jgi:hypothetical protein